MPSRVTSLDQLTALYREPGEGAVKKERQSVDETVADFIAGSTFLVLATGDGQGSLDASPRGGPPGFVRVLDERHIAIPDLNGNNRLDSYRNLIAHPYAAVLMMIPGKEETVRINGPAAISTDPDLLAGFTKELRVPKLAIVIETDQLFGHCAKALRRGKLWEPEAWSRAAQAPDLARMYAKDWQMDEGELRQVLAGAYDDDLGHD